MLELRCKEGDLAIIVRGSNPKNLGKIVTCVKFKGTIPEGLEADHWLIDQDIEWVSANDTNKAYLPYCRDFNLKPIGYPEGTDEMLEIVNSKETV